MTPNQPLGIISGMGHLLTSLPFLGGSLATLAGYAFKKWSDPRRRARRAFKGVSDTPIAEILDGDRVRVTGLVGVRGQMTTSPVGQRSCIAFRLVVEAKEYNGSGEAWNAVLIREACAPFSIADETGSAAVEGPFLIGLDPDDGGWANLPPTLFALLEQARVSLAGRWGGDREFRFSEAVLKPRDRISVLGRAWHEVDPAGESAGFRKPPMLLHLKGSGDEPVVIADAEDPIGA
jgi:hypothetical protein